MKAKVLSKTGQELRDVELPSWFSDKVREDICQKYFETSKTIQPYGPFYLAGKLHSASGILKHARHQWKTTYGHGMSRVPRKIMWRRGDQFYWVGASVSGTRGGRRVHAPQPEHFMVEKRINKKEKLMAMKSALICTANADWIKKRYDTLKDSKLSVKLPFVIDSSMLKLGTKDFLKSIEKIIGEMSELAIQKTKIRPGRGGLRRGKHKKTAGMLLIVGKKENAKIPGIEIRKVNEVSILDLFPLGRLTVYSEEAIKELKNLGGKNV